MKKLTGESSNIYIGAAVDARYYTYTVRAYLTYNKKTYYGEMSSLPVSGTPVVIGTSRLDQRL